MTTTCRAALLTLAVMEPLRSLLAAKGMLEVGLGAGGLGRWIGVAEWGAGHDGAHCGRRAALS